MEQNRFNVATDGKIIKTNEKWFKFFVYLPLIVAIIYSLPVIVVSIVLSIVIDPLWATMLTALAGAPLVYCITKLALSYKILHIYYLKQIANGSVSIENSANEEGEEELPEI